jgi:hypothetical protein
MGVGGYIEPGIDPALPAWARAEPVTNATTWPFGLHGFKGHAQRPERDAHGAGAAGPRAPRAQSLFDRTFTRSELLAAWKSRRADASRVEAQDLITRLNSLRDSPQHPLSPLRARARRTPAPCSVSSRSWRRIRSRRRRRWPTCSSPMASRSPSPSARRSRPTWAVNRSWTARRWPSTSATAAHRGAQAIMWSRLLSVAGRLIELLERGRIRRRSELLGSLADVLRQRLRAQPQSPDGRARVRQRAPPQQRLPDRLADAASGNYGLGGVDPEHHAHLRLRPHDRPAGARAAT